MSISESSDSLFINFTGQTEATTASNVGSGLGLLFCGIVVIAMIGLIGLYVINKIKDEDIFDHDKELNNLEILFTKIEDDN